MPTAAEDWECREFALIVVLGTLVREGRKGTTLAQNAPFESNFSTALVAAIPDQLTLAVL